MVEFIGFFLLLIIIGAVYESIKIHLGGHNENLSATTSNIKSNDKDVEVKNRENNCKRELRLLVEKINKNIERGKTYHLCGYYMQLAEYHVRGICVARDMDAANKYCDLAIDSASIVYAKKTRQRKIKELKQRKSEILAMPQEVVGLSNEGMYNQGSKKLPYENNAEYKQESGQTNAEEKLTLTFTISEDDLSTKGRVTKEKREFIKLVDKLENIGEAKQSASICRILMKLAEYYASGHGVDKNLKKSEDLFNNAILCATALYSDSTRDKKVKEFKKRKSTILEKTSEEKPLSSKPRANISKYL